MKICSKCGVEETPDNKFKKHSRICKKCTYAAHRLWRARTLPDIIARRAMVEPPAQKMCPYCKEEKEAAKFYKNKASKDRLSYACKSCTNERNKVTSSKPESREKILAKARAKRREDPTTAAKEKKYGQEYNQRPHVKERMRLRGRTPKMRKATNDRQKKRRQTDPGFRLRLNLRARVKSALQKGIKTGSAIRDLGCSVEECREHIESLFQPGMTWDNWGSNHGYWNIDHIMPLSMFNLNDRQHFLLAAHYLNLQPLWYADNLAKNRAVFKETLLKEAA